jgi:tRNA threonylcarbamoyladenosine modification (KEOPS) complex  Pcc1 subunit
MGIKAEFVLEDEDEIIKTVYESVKEEKENKTKLEDKDKDRRFFVDLALKGNKLSVCISGEDIVKVRAAANTWLRLSKIAEEMVQVVRECDSHGF